MREEGAGGAHLHCDLQREAVEGAFHSSFLVGLTYIGGSLVLVI